MKTEKCTSRGCDCMGFLKGLSYAIFGPLGGTIINKVASDPVGSVTESVDRAKNVGNTVMKHGAQNMQHHYHEFERTHGDKLTDEQKEELHAKKDLWNKYR